MKYQIPLLLLLISLFPFAGLGFYTLHKSTGAAKSQVFSMEMEYLSRSSLQLESNLSYAQSYFTSQATQSLLAKYVYGGALDYREYSALIQVQRWLSGFLSPQNLLDGIYFINFEQDYVIGSAVTSSFTDIPDNPLYILLDESAQRQETIFWTYIAPWEGLPRPGKNENISIEGITLFIKCPMYSNSRQSAILVSLNMEKLASFLKRTDNRNQPLTIIDEHNIIIYHKDSSLIGSPADILPFYENLDLTKDRNTSYLKCNGQKLYISYLKGSNGWLYLTQSEASLVETQIHSLWKLFFLTGSFAVLAILAVVFVIYRWLYHPIQLLVSQLQPENIPYQKNKNEFQIIDAGFTALLDKKTRAEQQVVQFRHTLREFFFLKLIKNQLTPAEIQTELIQLDIRSQYPLMAVMVFQYLNHGDFEQNTDLPKAAGEIYQILPMEQTIAHTFYNGLFVVLLGSCQEEARFISSLFQISEKVTLELAREGSIITVGISQLFSDFSQVQKAYIGSVNALTYRTTTNRDILMAVPQPDASSSGPGFPSALAEQLSFALRNGNKEEAKQLVRRISQCIYGTSRDSRVYDTYVLRSASYIVSAIDELDVSGCRIYESLPVHIYEGLQQIHNAASMNHYFICDLVKPLLNWIEARGSVAQQELSQKVIAIIKENFDTDLTLDTCAKMLNYHSTYIWQVFKEQTHTTFAQYLEDYRFHMAKKWLRESKKPVAEIAARLQYSNSQNFIRSFKKKMGITPGTYREQNRE